MIIWRGWGLLVLVGLLAAFVVAIGLATLIASQLYPGDPYSVDLLQAFNSQLSAIVLVLGGAVGAVAMWFIGKRLNVECNFHTLFFVPLQWWGPLLGLLFGGLACYWISTDGVTRATHRFVQSCIAHEADATQAICDCFALRIEKASAPRVFIPFYAEAQKVWSSAAANDVDILTRFAETYLPRLPQPQSEAFLRAYNDSVSCFGTAR